MTLSLERAGTRRPITWLTIVGALLLPVVIGGILVAALYNPTERLGQLSAAIVNDDQPVTVNGQLVPLGRQLSAGLVEGSDDLPSNLSWTISNDEDAAAGLADGTYTAVITIPENFSAAATSTAPGGTPERATISVQTPPDSRVVDDAISAQVAQAAASLTGTMLSETYLQNVLLGFTTLGDQLGTAADGAAQLADGAAQLTDGATQAADGAGQLPAGAAALAAGAGSLSSGAGQLAAGIDRVTAGIGQSADGAGQLAAGAGAGAAQLRADGLVPTALTDTAGLAATAAAGTSTGVDALVAQLTGIRDLACQTPGELCTQAATALATAQGTQQGATGAKQATAGLNGGLTQFAAAAPEQLAQQLDAVAGGAGTLQSGLNQLADGSAQSAAGARALGSGAGQLGSGADQLGTGAQSLADGIAQLSTGGAALTSGAEGLASGLRTAVDQVPSYTETEAQDLAAVVADPVVTEGIGTSLFGASAVPLLATVALWFGSLGTFVALRATTSRALSSTRPSALLALRGLWPAAVIGAAQGLLVAIVVQVAARYDWGDWWMFAAASVVAGVAFAAVNQALVAVLGGAGRWLSALVGVFAVASGVVSTIPTAIGAVASALPTAPATAGMIAALTSASGFGAALVALTVWALLALVVTILAVARRRRVSARQLLAPSPA